MARQKLDDRQVLQIKAKLWDGYAQHVIAREFGISQAYVSQISLGYVYDYIPWPDGRDGQFPDYRLKEIEGIRGQRKAVKKMGFTSALEDSRLMQSERFTPEELQQAEAMYRDFMKQKEEEKRIADERESAERAARVEAGIMKRERERELVPAQEETPVYPPMTLEALSWDEALAVASHNSYLQEADERNDALERFIVCFLFKQIPRGQWEDAIMGKLQKQVRDNILQRGLTNDLSAYDISDRKEGEGKAA